MNGQLLPEVVNGVVVPEGGRRVAINGVVLVVDRYDRVVGDDPRVRPTLREHLEHWEWLSGKPRTMVDDRA